MNKIILTLVSLFTLLTAGAQNCIDVLSANFENPSGDGITWRLVINWQAEGTKHLFTTIRMDNVVMMTACFETHPGSGGGGVVRTGTLIYDNIVTLSDSSRLTATFVRKTGTCGNGTVCDSTQTLIHGVLPIKLEWVKAKNQGSTTEVTFKIGQVEGATNEVTLNFTKKSGALVRHKITLPQKVSPGEVWRVVVNNKTGEYTSKKL